MAKSVDAFCDHTDPLVVELSKQLLSKTKSSCNADDSWEKSYAVATFNWVRDKIQYKVLYNWSVPVSYTLEHRQGNCGTKACLLVALLRAAGIQAEFFVERIDTVGTFFFVPSSITSLCNKKSIHFSSAIKLSKEQPWLHLDCTTDWKLATGMSGVVGKTFQVIFDGQTHAVAGGHQGFGPGVLRVPSIERYMRKTSRLSPRVRECFNLSADYCRKVGIHFKTAEKLERDTEAYLMTYYKDAIMEALPFLRAAQIAEKAASANTAPYHPVLKQTAAYRNS